MLNKLVCKGFLCRSTKLLLTQEEELAKSTMDSVFTCNVLGPQIFKNVFLIQFWQRWPCWVLGIVNVFLYQICWFQFLKIIFLLPSGNCYLGNIKDSQIKTPKSGRALGSFMILFYSLFLKYILENVVRHRRSLCIYCRRDDMFKNICFILWK